MNRKRKREEMERTLPVHSEDYPFDEFATPENQVKKVIKLTDTKEKESNSESEQEDLMLDGDDLEEFLEDFDNEKLTVREYMIEDSNM